MNLSEMIVGEWAFRVSDHQEFFPPWAVEQALDLIEEWRKVFPREETWVQGNYNVPSLIIRLDCVLRGKKLWIYEIEERPAGVGVVRIINLYFRAKLDQIMMKWPSFGSVVSPRRKTCDDYLWLPDSLEDSSLVLVRAEPEETEFHHLQIRSVSTLLTKGRKDYGSALGWWEEVSLEDFASLPWEEGFVLKPLQGSKCRGVEIWGGWKLKGIKGGATKSRIRRVLEENERMYLQRLLPPMRIENGMGVYYMIYRLFFGYDPQDSTFLPLGGIWMSRPNLRIHGATDSIVGNLVL